MKRREFFKLAGGAAASVPLAARAQQKLPTIGFLSSRSSNESSSAIGAFREALKEAGYIEGHNVAIEYRWAEGEPGRLPALAADLVGQEVTAIFAAGGSEPARAAAMATARIPIVFTSATDPVKAGTGFRQFMGFASSRWMAG
jgi:putative ABC transport system substrate-binding protein